ncbi:protein N-terminal glutamine amidohydrolase-like protein [Dinothrombium tinctorium]|uniref:Protein N-terminal glutamine amidohydrolase n=1 Tax=Dinothrombium tinctorium TaxID=1965070 RepID=A0A3S3PIA4_9ACAR|nr:protein N-terminal glutamine amidohydrolase-like protein [Dinothrombium tinctorium]RWS01648.1 protein N-terminal glutamine amidohydrolase-like protein [Dinothrombium tinctorium]RWS12829.1 protein N-terminal glutamine amidohydrolase-like protein [Dinothrombium tinctorium]
MLAVPELSECVYTPCFCEENVWKLCESISKRHQLKQCHVVFVSNDNESIPIFKSKSGDQMLDHLTVWDYHVFLIYSPTESEPLVYDFDTLLAFPCKLVDYIKLSLQTERYLQPKHRRMFRVIKAEDYLKKFSSDRSRMRREDGTWIKQPPSYPCILAEDGKSNLNDLISMSMERCDIGMVFDFTTFQSFFMNRVIC